MQNIIKHIPKSTITNITKNVVQKNVAPALITKPKNIFEIQNKNTKIIPYEQYKLLTLNPKIKEIMPNNNIILKPNINYNQSIEVIKTKINNKINENYNNKIKILENFKNSLKILSINKKSSLYIFYTIIISILIQLSIKTYNENSLFDLADYFSNFSFDDKNYSDEYNKLLYIKNKLNDALYYIKDKEIKEKINIYINNINNLLEEEKNIGFALKYDNTLIRENINHELEELRNELNNYKKEINNYDNLIYINKYNNTKYENIDLKKIIAERSELENELKNKKNIHIIEDKLKEINKKYNIDINDDNDKLIKIDLALKYIKTEDKFKKLKKTKKNNILFDYKNLDIVNDIVNYSKFEKQLNKNISYDEFKLNINELNNKIKKNEEEIKIVSKKSNDEQTTKYIQNIKNEVLDAKTKIKSLTEDYNTYEKAKKNIINKIDNNNIKMKKIIQNNEFINDLILKKQNIINNFLTLKTDIDKIKDYNENFINNINILLINEKNNINNLHNYKNYLSINKNEVLKEYNTNINYDNINSKIKNISNYINNKEKLEETINEKKKIIDNLTIMKEKLKETQNMFPLKLIYFGFKYNKYTKTLGEVSQEIYNINK